MQKRVTIGTLIGKLDTEADAILAGQVQTLAGAAKFLVLAVYPMTPEAFDIVLVESETEK